MTAARRPAITVYCDKCNRQAPDDFSRKVWDAIIDAAQRHLDDIPCIGESAGWYWMALPSKKTAVCICDACADRD